MRKIHWLNLILIFVFLIMVGCAAPSPTPTQTIELTDLTQTKSLVNVETEGVVLHYQNESYWEEGQYPRDSAE